MPDENRDWLFDSLAAFRMRHAMLLLGLGSIFCCGGTCVVLRSCNQTELVRTEDVESTPLRAEDLTSLIEPTKPKAGKDGWRRRTLNDFTPEQRVLANRMIIGDWKLIAAENREAIAAYLALIRHPEDSSVLAKQREWYYLLGMEDAATRIPAAKNYELDAVCIVADERLAQEAREEVRK